MICPQKLLTNSKKQDIEQRNLELNRIKSEIILSINNNDMLPIIVVCNWASYNTVKEIEKYLNGLHHNKYYKYVVSLDNINRIYVNVDYTWYGFFCTEIF